MSTTADRLHVTVAYSDGPRQLWQVDVDVPAGATLADALAASGLLQAHPEVQDLPVGIWGRKESMGATLRERDRIEVYRPLRCDPKEARRIRYQQRKQRLQAEAAEPATAPVAAAPAADLSGNPTT
jgi:putative ubiquitin-RnfH superfamily antitoxin RatB of RatAB toxin-antitoxin module